MKRLVCAVFGVLLGCGSDGSSNVDSGGGNDGSITSEGGAEGGADGGSDSPSNNDAQTSDGGVPKGTIFTIVLENHDYKEIVGSSNAPYLNSLIQSYGLATNYKDSLTHPSLPNYLFMISGDTQYPGIIDVDPTQYPYFPASQPNLGSQMETGAIAWRSYQESAGGTCVLSGSGNYAPKHDPFLYFDNIQNGPNGLCAKRNVDYAAAFASDLAGGAYRYMWITPNLLDDGHDPSNDPVTGLKQSDDWCKTEIPKILASNAYKNDGVIFITWDEAEGRNGDDGDQVPMIIVSTKIKSPGYKSNLPYNHGSYLATVEDLMGLPRLAKVMNAKNMLEFFQ